VSDLDGAVETVRALLPSVALQNVYFDEIYAQRVAGEDVQEDGVAETAIGMEVQRTTEALAYRFRINAKRLDVDTTVAVITVYRLEGAHDAFDDGDVQRTFGELVALPAAYPYARTKIHELTSGMAVPPLILGVYVPQAGSMKPVEALST
jgi:hypothetical protein